MIDRIAILLLVNILFYLKTMTYKYCSDDVQVLKNPPKFRNEWERRWLQLQGQLKVNEQEDHAQTILFHALTCVFIYTAFGANDVSFLAALLFSFNPINNQGSVWIAGRGYVLPALLMLMAMTFNNPVFLLFSTFFNAGFFSPLVFLGSDYAWFMLIVPFAWFYHYKQFRGNVERKMKDEMYDDDRKIKPQKLILAVKTFGFYLTHAIIPIKTTFYHSFMQSVAGNEIMQKRAYGLDRFFWIGVISIGAMIFYASTHKWDMVCFALLWWTVGIGPFLNLYRMSQEISERYVYLPNVGLMYVLAYFIVKVIGGA